MRHIWSWVCAESVDRHNVTDLLKSGVSVCLCPGGVREVIFMAQQQQKKYKKGLGVTVKGIGKAVSLIIEEEEEEECVLFLRSRKGFVRLALQYGCPLVPMFTFGQREVLVPWFCNNSLINLIGHKCGYVAMVYFGVWNLPFGIPR
jgi:hypothetical protein